MGQEFVVPSFNTNRYYNRNTDSIMTLPTGATAGSVLFVGADGTVDQDNANFFWDDTNNRLGIGTASPLIPLVIGYSSSTVSVGGNSFGIVFNSGSNRGTRIGYDDTSGSMFGSYVMSNADNTRAASTLTARFTNSQTIRLGLSNTDASSGISFYTDSGLTAGNTFTPTQRMKLDFLGRMSLTPGAATSGTTAQFILTPGADTGLTASTESNVFRVDAATRTWATGALAANYDVRLNGMTYAFAGASTVTLASTLFVTSPIAGTNATITNNYATHFQATAVASGAEKIALFTVSDDATGKLEILNVSSSDGVFQPGIRATIGSTTEGLGIESAITTDTGAAAGMYFQSKAAAGAVLTTRPLFQWLNFGTVVQAINAQGKHTLTPIASTSGVVANWVLTPGANTGMTASTESNVFRIDTATRTWADGTVALQRDFLFTAQTYNKTTTSATFTQAATVAITDTPRQGTGVTITTSIGLLIQNSAAATGTMPNGYGIKAISPTGATISYAGWFQASAIASAGETIAKFDVSDDAVSKLEVLNASATDSLFVPFLRGTGASTNQALLLGGVGTTDTGTNPIIQFDSRIGAATAVATRPVFKVNNNGVNVLLITGTTAGSALQTLGGRIKAVRSVSSTTITVAVTDHIVLSSTGGGAVAVSLPASPETGREYTIKDNVGDAATNNITITPAAGNIDGAGTYVMNANYESATFVYNGTQWNVVSSYN